SGTPGVESSPPIGCWTISRSFSSRTSIKPAQTGNAPADLPGRTFPAGGRATLRLIAKDESVRKISFRPLHHIGSAQWVVFFLKPLFRYAALPDRRPSPIGAG